MITSEAATSAGWRSSDFYIKLPASVPLISPSSAPWALVSSKRSRWLLRMKGTEGVAVTERRFAVAIHEAGHAVVFAFLGVDVPYVQMGLDPDPSGHTPGRDIPLTDRVDF